MKHKLIDAGFILLNLLGIYFLPGPRGRLDLLNSASLNLNEADFVLKESQWLGKDASLQKAIDHISRAETYITSFYSGDHERSATYIYIFFGLMIFFYLKQENKKIRKIMISLNVLFLCLCIILPRIS